MQCAQATEEFQHPVPASTFASRDFATAFFRTKRCFRFNQTLCAKEGSPWYEVSGSETARPHHVHVEPAHT